jgi:hypothetical protein
MTVVGPLRFNLAWSLLVAAALVALLLLRAGVGTVSVEFVAVLLAAVCYVVISVLALRLRRWAVAVCLLVAGAVAIYWLPTVVLNFFYFLTRHELYQDSPATILAVGINSVVFLIPALILCLAYGVRVRQLVSMFRAPSGNGT